MIDGSSDTHSTAQNVLTQQDSMWLDSSFTRIFCIIAAQLHVYGAGSAFDQSGGPTQPVPDQLHKPAITNAIAAVRESLCGPSAVLLASPSGQGTVTPAHSEYLFGTIIQRNWDIQTSIHAPPLTQVID